MKIETERLILRGVTEEDMKPLSRLFADRIVMKYSQKGPYSFEKSEKILLTMLENEKKHGFGACAVLCKETGDWLGFCGLWWEEIDGEWKTDFGYRFFSEFWGRGYATESVKACLLYISEHLPHVTIFSYIEPTNKASLRVVEKVGMIFVEKSINHDLPVIVFRYQSEGK